jgi:hypothetical protein
MTDQPALDHPVCKECQTLLQPVRDGQGGKRYDCPACIIRFDLSRLTVSLESVGMSNRRSKTAA